MYVTFNGRGLQGLSGAASMIGQMSIWDVMDPEPKQQKGDCSSCLHEFWKHPPKGGTPVRGKCITCEYEPKASCYTCSYYRMTVDAYTCEPTGVKTCSKFEAWSQNKNLDPENGCELWEEKS